MRKPILELLDALLALSVAGYSVYAAVDDSGLYAWLSELQARKLGGHVPLLTMAIASVPWVLAAWTVHAAAKRVFGESSSVAAPLPKTSSVRLLWQLGIVLLAAGIAAGAAAYRSSDAQRVYAILDASLAPPPHAKWVELTGTDQARAAVTVQLGDSGTEFTPVTPPNWRAAEPVMYFGEGPAFIQAAPGKAPKQTRRGVLVKNGLPSVAKAGFGQRGLVIAEPHYVIDPSPLSEVLGYVIAVVCVIGALICLLSAMLVRRQRAGEGVPTSRSTIRR